ncbi:MAG: transcriptional repressor [Proteobacteria bacterium]|nr:Fur family transcriptional regulator [Desulfobulbaceae bacterium]MBU4151310.1 transcriptional repressor [Pseudomonadota bacterium]
MSFLTPVSDLIKKVWHKEQPTPAPIVVEEHRHDREQFQTVLESFKASRIPERLAILDIFLEMELHMSISELFEMVRRKKPELDDRTFLQETMAMFCQYGFAQRLDFDNQESRFEHMHLGNHHDHFICTKCGLIQEFKDDVLETLQLKIAGSFNFHVLQHKTEIYGLCNRCLASREPTLPLHLAANGERVRIVKVIGSREVVSRLADMGLVVGASLDVISNHPTGPFVVIVNKTRLALGTGIPQQILVSHYCRHEGSS